MAFKYKPTYDTEFVSKERKAELIETNEPFEITKIRRNPGQFGIQFYLKVRFADNSEGTMTFSAESGVFTRDDLLEQLMAYLDENKGESVVARLRQDGNTKLIDIEEE